MLVKASFTDGTSDYVSAKATYQSSDNSIAVASPGRISTKKPGTASITIRYGGLEKTIPVKTSYFLLLSEAMNLTMFGVNTFDNLTHTLHISQWGQAGWSFANGIDLSDYRYLVFKFGTFNYPWGTHIKVKNGTTESREYKWEGTKQLIIDLKNITTDNGTVISPAHITAVRFWSAGGDLVVDNVYVTNKADASEETTGLSIHSADKSGDDLVDVYSVLGKLLKKQVKRNEAVTTLKNGVYIIDNQKIVISHQ